MNKSLPLVSVLMTAYNREKYIGEAIESVLASSYENFELIITDDLSKDNTVLICKKYEERDSRIKVYINETNLGDYPNRNKAASHAKGKYLKYVDADDYIYPWGLELLITLMEKFPDAGWGLCSLTQIKERPYPFRLNCREAYEHHYFGPGLFHKAPLSAIFTKQAFETVGGFSALRMVGDIDMWHKMALNYPVVLMPDGIVWYREHDSQEINSVRRFLLAYEDIMLKYLHRQECPLSKDQVKYIVAQRRKKAVKSIFYNLFKLNLKGALDNNKIFWFYLRKSILTPPTSI